MTDTVARGALLGDGELRGEVRGVVEQSATGTGATAGLPRAAAGRRDLLAGVTGDGPVRSAPTGRTSRADRTPRATRATRTAVTSRTAVSTVTTRTTRTAVG